MGLVLALGSLSGAVEADCVYRSRYIALTLPDSRYEAADPAGAQVRDKVTGLIWQRCVQGMAWDSRATPPTCTATGGAATFTWRAALGLPQLANAQMPAATPWRVPNTAELISLVETACINPAINATWFVATPAEPAWSSSPFADSAGYAWSIRFEFGEALGDRVDVEYRVRLVRSAPAQ